MIKKNTSIGIIGSIRGLSTILNQEGITFESISIISYKFLKKFSVILIDDIDSKDNFIEINKFISSGGFVIMSSKVWKILFNGKIKLKTVSFLEVENNSLFPNVGLLDIYNKIQIPINHSLLALDSNLKIFESPLGLGKIIIYPFNLFLLLNDYNIMRKRFFDNRLELPSERVSVVSKNKIRKIIFYCIKYCFHSQNIPLVTLWHYPNRCNSLFIFRIDTDFCSLNNAKKLYNLCRKYDIPGSWFLDTEKENMLKNFYGKMKNQELGLHCDIHKVYQSKLLNKININNGLKKLNAYNINAKGFASPFGEWNPSLANSINKFEYSSEFGFDYDNFPFFPYINDKASSVLQIPIHPIGISRLNRSHYSELEMFKYYLKLFNKKINNNEPIIIYFHPNNNHFSVLEKIFSWINNNNIMTSNMIDFSSWWKKKCSININYSYFNDNSILINEKKCVEKNYIKIHYNNKYSIVQSSSKINLSKLIWINQLKHSFEKDISRIRKFHWRDLLHNFESYKARRQF